MRISRTAMSCGTLAAFRQPDFHPRNDTIRRPVFPAERHELITDTVPPGMSAEGGGKDSSGELRKACARTVIPIG
jgi:hypothetical protein